MLRDAGFRRLLSMRKKGKGLTLRACESFDSAVFQCESNQGLTNSENVENRIDSQTLRSPRQRPSRRARLLLGGGGEERTGQDWRGLMLRDARCRGLLSMRGKAKKKDRKSGV